LSKRPQCGGEEEVMNERIEEGCDLVSEQEEKKEVGEKC
jgi:hypothetical protein